MSEDVQILPESPRGMGAARLDAGLDAVGFTASRDGITTAQCHVLATELRGAGRFHHGDCVGGDANAHHIAKALGIRTVRHPAKVPASLRAFCTSDETREAKPPLARNIDIVDETNRLIACPKGYAEEQRSGTWATVRYARKIRRPITIIWPDGSVSRELKRTNR